MHAQEIILTLALANLPTGYLRYNISTYKGTLYVHCNILSNRKLCVNFSSFLEIFQISIILYYGPLFR